jgi:riboflavin synthase
MFTGIVQGIATIVSASRTADLLKVVVQFPPGGLDGVQLGASISLNGCCLTVVAVEPGNLAAFDLVQETIARCNLRDSAPGMQVNFERSLRVGDEVGGHFLSGHVDAVASLVGLERYEESRDVTLEAPAMLMKYIFEKGYVALNGASLTVASVERELQRFRVSLIPETLSRTTFGVLGVGSTVNVEVDRTTQAVVETVERMLKSRV